MGWPDGYTLIDFQEKDRQAIESMWRRKLIKKKQVFTYADFVDGKEADVEDLFGATFYLKLVNDEYSLPAALAAKDLKSKHPRITVCLEEHFSKNPLPAGALFNHYRPARYLTENVGNLEVPAVALDRFERICKAVNALLA